MLSRLQYFWNYLTSDPIGFLLFIVALLAALILHECAHGYVAHLCGDNTARMLGRLTLNPAKHLDPIGTLCMLFLGVGWAKPVPINPRWFRHYKRDYVFVSAAGIVTNFLLFLLSLTFYYLIYRYVQSYSRFIGYLTEFLLTFGTMNLGLAVFNLLPVPPLDGYRILDRLVFKGSLRMTQQTENIIRIVFLVLCLSGMLNGLLTTVENAVWSFFSGLLFNVIF